MVDRVILQGIVGDTVPTEFAVLVHRFHAFRTESLPKQPPVVAFVGGENVQFVEIAFDQLPADLGIVRLFHRAMYVENHTSLAVDQHRGFHRLKRVVHPFCVVLASSAPIHTGCVDRLNGTGVVQLCRQPQ